MAWIGRAGLDAAAGCAGGLDEEGRRVDAPVRGGGPAGAHQPFDPLPHRVADGGRGGGRGGPVPAGDLADAVPDGASRRTRR